MRSSLLFVALPFLCRLATSTPTSSSQPVLVPVSDDGWATSIQRRSAKSLFELLGYEHLVWSSPPESNDTVFVNMTLFTADDELVISMERFAPELKQVNCSQNMMMSFKSNSSYQYAIKSWDWVNFNEQRTFIMIANAPGCGRARSRQPWVVSNVDYDPKHLIVHLNATKKSWKEVAHTYNMDFGQYSPAPVSSKVRRFSFDKQVNLNLAATLPVDFYSSVDISQNFNLGITCSGCGTKGTLTLAGHVETSWFSLKTFTLSAAPNGVQADLDLKFALSATDPDQKWKKDWDFFVIPLGGFSIPEILTLGPALTVGAGISITGLKGKATLSSSVTAKISDSALAEIQLAGNKGVTFHGWEPQWSSGPLDVSAQISASVEVYGKAEVGITLELLGNGIDVGLLLKLPDVVLTASEVENVHGVCADKKHTEGVSLDASFGADLSITGETEEGGSSSTFLNEPIFHSGAAWRPNIVCIGFGPLVRAKA